LAWTTGTPSGDGYILQRSADGGSSWVTIYTGAATSACDDVCDGTYQYQVCATKSGCSDSGYRAGSSSCVVTLCFPNDANRPDWYKFGKPRCWCYSRQCRGDTDGLKDGTSTKTGYWYVGGNDVATFIKAYGILEPTKGPGVQGEPNICADFDHKQEGTSTKTGYWRVGGNDVAIFIASYSVLEPPKGSGVPTCSGTYIDPCQPRPCN
jgi:hypothetical protein